MIPVPAGGRTWIIRSGPRPAWRGGESDIPSLPAKAQPAPAWRAKEPELQARRLPAGAGGKATRSYGGHAGLIERKLFSKRPGLADFADQSAR